MAQRPPWLPHPSPGTGSSAPCHGGHGEHRERRTRRVSHGNAGVGASPAPRAPMGGGVGLGGETLLVQVTKNPLTFMGGSPNLASRRPPLSNRHHRCCSKGKEKAFCCSRGHQQSRDGAGAGAGARPLPASLTAAPAPAQGSPASPVPKPQEPLVQLHGGQSPTTGLQSVPKTK